MTKNEKKIIYILFCIIIIFSSILILKIETSEYDKDTYAQVYEEYEEIMSNISLDSSQIKDDMETHRNTNDTEIYTIDYTPKSTVAVIEIPDINISYPVINEYTEKNVNIAPTKLAGPGPNEIGNFVIVGHNTWDNKYFSNLHKLEKYDIVELKDTSGKKVLYRVYELGEIEQNDLSCLEQETNGEKHLTLITCIKNKPNKRLVVKCNSI